MRIIPRTSRVLSNRRTYDLINEFILTWEMDCISSVGASPGTGDCPYGNASIVAGEFVAEAQTSPSQWVDCTVDEPTRVHSDVFSLGESSLSLNLTLAATEDGGLGRSHLMKLSVADSLLADTSNRIAAALFQQVQQRIANSPNSRYRIWCSYRRCIRRLAQLEVVFRDKLLAACYPQRSRRKGLQSVSVRKKRRKRGQAIPREGWFRFGGSWAYRNRVGRPPLSEAEWLRRYVARLKKRRKTKRMKNPHKVKVPSLASGRARPARTFSPPHGNNTSQPRNLFLGQSDPSASVEDYWNPSELDPVLIAGTFPDMSGQV